MALTFTQQQELETLLQEFKQENRLYGTVQITMNNNTILFKSTRGVDGDTYEDIAYQRGYLAAKNEEVITDLDEIRHQSYQDGYDEGCADGYDEGYADGYDKGYLIACEEGE